MSWPNQPVDWRGVEPVGIGRRPGHVVDLPAREVRTLDVPRPPLLVRGEDERTLAGADQNPYTAHRPKLRRRARTVQTVCQSEGMKMMARWVVLHGLGRVATRRWAAQGDPQARLIADPSLREDPYPVYEQIRAGGDLNVDPARLHQRVARRRPLGTAVRRLPHHLGERQRAAPAAVVGAHDPHRRIAPARGTVAARGRTADPHPLPRTGLVGVHRPGGGRDARRRAGGRRPAAGRPQRSRADRSTSSSTTAPSCRSPSSATSSACPTPTASWCWSSVITSRPAWTSPCLTGSS